MAKEKTVALIYDFDKTLAISDMQNFKFIENLGMTVDEFWGLTSEFCNDNHCERILGYLFVMMRECKKKGIDLTDHEKICLCDAVRVISTYEHLDYFQKCNREESEALKDDEPAE